MVNCKKWLLIKKNMIFEGYMFVYLLFVSVVYQVFICRSKDFYNIVYDVKKKFIIIIVVLFD